MQVNPSEFGIDDERNGIELQGDPGLLEGFFVFSSDIQDLGVPVMGCGMVWIEFQREFEFLLRTFQVPFIAFKVIGERIVRFTQVLVNFKSF